MTELTVQQAPEAASPIAMASVAMMMDSTKLQSLITFAEMMAKSTISVPDHLRGKPSDCLAIAMQAAQWGMNPFQVAQKTHIVSGKLGYEAQLVNAVVQASGQIKGGFKYEFDGEGLGLKCRVGAVLRGDSEITWGEWLCIAEVTTKNSPLWKTNPKQQMAYLQTKNWSRLYCPGAILGIYSDDELIDADTPLPPGTRQMGPVDEVKRPTTVDAMPTDAAQFEANLPTWTGVIQSGRKTPDQIIDMVQTKARLSDEQKARIREIHRGARAELARVHEAQRALQRQMAALMAAPQIDTTAAEALRQQLSAGRDAASKRLLQARLDAAAVLTPEQRQKLAEHMAQRREMRERHWRERQQLDTPRG